jgi:hypothetical protein
LFRVCVNDDLDGACPAAEDLATNNGDGNADGTPDLDQSNVTSRRNIFNRLVTWEVRPELRIDQAQGLQLPDPKGRLQLFVPPPQTSVQFNDGFYALIVTAVTDTMKPTGEVVTLYDNTTSRPTGYYAFAKGPPGGWFDFTFDGTTGAEILSDRIVLHFVDGGRGDDDGAADGTIRHVGGPAIETAIPPPGDTNDWGCSVATNPRRMTQAADWGVVFAFLAFAFARNRRRF